MANRLEQQDLRSEFNGFYGRRECTHETIAITAGIVTGVGLYALAEGSSIYKLVKIPKVTIERLNQYTGRVQKITVPAPGYNGADTFWTLATIIGGMMVYPVAAGGVGIGIYFLTQELANTTLWPTRKLEQEMNDGYQSNGEISGEDVQRVVAQLDQKAVEALISKMNFRQLAAARLVLDHQVFQQAITQVNNEPHKNWAWLGKLEKRTDYQAIPGELSSRSVQRLCQDPYFQGALDEACPAPAKTRSPYLHWIQSRDAAPDITLMVGGKAIPANKEVLGAHSGYFRSMFSDTYQHSSQMELREVSYDDALLLINMLSGKTVDFDANLCKQLLPLADRFCANRLLSSIQAYILNHRQAFDCYALLEHYPSLNLLRDALEEELLAKKTPVYSWEEDARLIKKYNFSKYKAAFAKAAGAYLQQNQATANMIQVLNICKEVWDQPTYQGQVQTLLQNPSGELLRALFAYGKEHDAWVTGECVRYCRHNTQMVLQLAPWDLGEVPDELLDILYPPPSDASEQW